MTDRQSYLLSRVNATRNDNQVGGDDEIDETIKMIKRSSSEIEKRIKNLLSIYNYGSLECSLQVTLSIDLSVRLSVGWSVTLLKFSLKRFSNRITM